MKRENSFLSKKQLNVIKDQLLAAKEQILNEQKSLEDYCLDRNELADPLDEASVNVQTSQELRFRNRKMFYLKKVNKALKKLDDGTLGLCQDCDAEISFERLKARPTADLCITCKEESEFSEKNNFFDKKSKSLGKTLHEIARA